MKKKKRHFQSTLTREEEKLQETVFKSLQLESHNLIMLPYQHGLEIRIEEMSTLGT